MKGSYVLLINLPEAQTITIAKAEVHFPRGGYAYVGSARNGIKSRLSRHLKKDKKPHWHIDYLLQKASVTDIIISETKDSVECAIAQIISSQFDSIPGFGSSDCHCHSHLFFASGEQPMKTVIVAALKSLAIPSKLVGLR